MARRTCWPPPGPWSGGGAGAAEAIPVPELPEVETSRRGIAPLVSGQQVVAVQIRQPGLLMTGTEATVDRLAGTSLKRVPKV